MSINEDALFSHKYEYLMRLLICFRYWVLILLFVVPVLPANAFSIATNDTTRVQQIQGQKDASEPKKKNKLAVKSLILSGAGFLFAFLPILSVLTPFLLVGGVVTGIISLSQIKKRNEKGAGFAIAGLIVGGVLLLSALVVVLVVLSSFN